MISNFEISPSVLLEFPLLFPTSEESSDEVDSKLVAEDVEISWEVFDDSLESEEDKIYDKVEIFGVV